MQSEQSRFKGDGEGWWVVVQGRWTDCTLRSCEGARERHAQHSQHVVCDCHKGLQGGLLLGARQVQLSFFRHRAQEAYAAAQAHLRWPRLPLRLLVAHASRQQTSQHAAKPSDAVTGAIYDWAIASVWGHQTGKL